ncbi:MAG: hypothetical protein RR060_04660 [Victivallaceae bacterium]
MNTIKTPRRSTPPPERLCRNITQKLKNFFTYSPLILRESVVLMFLGIIVSGCVAPADEYPGLPLLETPAQVDNVPQLTPLTYSGDKIIYSRKFELTQNIDDVIVVYRLQLMPGVGKQPSEGVLTVAAAFRDNGKIQRQIMLPLRRFTLDNGVLTPQSADEFERRIYSSGLTGRTLYLEYFNESIDFLVQIEDTTRSGTKYYKGKISIPLNRLQ